MDMYERHVLRRKRPILSDTLTFSPQDQKKYRAKGLLDDSMIGEIMVRSEGLSAYQNNDVLFI